MMVATGKPTLSIHRIIFLSYARITLSVCPCLLSEIHLLSENMACSPLRIIGFRPQYRRSVVAHAAQPSPSRRIGNLRRELESKSGFSARQSEGVVETVDDLVTFATSDKLDRLFKGQVYYQAEPLTWFMHDCLMVEFHSIHRRRDRRNSEREWMISEREWRSYETNSTSSSWDFSLSPCHSYPAVT